MAGAKTRPRHRLPECTEGVACVAACLKPHVLLVTFQEAPKMGACHSMHVGDLMKKRLELPDSSMGNPAEQMTPSGFGHNGGAPFFPSDVLQCVFF